MGHDDNEVEVLGRGASVMVRVRFRVRCTEMIGLWVDLGFGFKVRVRL